jgi:DNA (cytosine-5)-methyltransferase 1
MRLLDLFCKAGGASEGYARAGFEIVGVDIEPQPHYPFEFVQADALAVLRCESWRVDPHFFDAIHASPPCQRYSLATPHERRHLHPDLLGPTRAALERVGVPWVIENVPGAPLRPDLSICGCQVGLALRRRRLFETSWHAFSFMPPCNHEGGPVVSVVGHGTPSWVRAQLGYNPTIQQYRDAMGIDWMNRNELSEAIPPAYTEFVGAQILEHLAVAA